MVPEFLSTETKRSHGPVTGGVFFPGPEDLPNVARQIDQNIFNGIVIDRNGTLSHHRIHPPLIIEHIKRSNTDSPESSGPEATPSPLAQVIAKELIACQVSAITFIGEELIPEITEHHD